AHSVLAGETETALRELNELAKQGKDLGRLVSDLLGHFRNLLIYRVSRGDLGMLEVSEAEAASLAEQSAVLSPDALTRVMEVFSECEMRLRDAASKKILIEVALLKAIEARNAVSLDSVLQQLQAWRGGAGGAGVNAPAAAQPAPRAASPAPTAVPAAPKRNEYAETPAPEPVAAPMKESAVSVPAGEMDLNQLWARLVEAVGRASPFTRTYLLEAHPVSLAKNVLTIGFDPEFEDHIGLVDNARNHTLLQTKLGELGHANAQIKFVKVARPEGWMMSVVPAASVELRPEAAAAPAKAPAAARSAEPKERAAGPAAVFDKNDFKNDPLIKKALDIFKGQIVEVRT